MNDMKEKAMGAVRTFLERKGYEIVDEAWQGSEGIGGIDLVAVDEDGTVDLSHAALGLYTRGEARKAVEDAALEAYFLRIARDLTSSFNDEGHHWPEMRAARPLWFQDKEEK